MKRSVLLLLLVLLLSIFVVLPLAAAGQQDEAAATPSAPQRTYIMVTTAGTGGTYYPMGVGMSTLWNDKLRAANGIVASAQSSGGSVENINILEAKEAELAILQADIGALAWAGQAPFTKKHTDLRSITALWPSQVQFVVRKDKIKTGNITDIKGLSFSLGAAGSGIERTALMTLEGIGMSIKDIKAHYLGYVEASNAMKDGNLDGSTLQGGAPVSAVSDLFASPLDVDILQYTQAQVDQINEVFNAYFLDTIPAGTYPGQTEDRKTLGITNFLAVRQDLSEEVVYLLTKTLFENLKYMISVHPAAKNITLEKALAGLPVPLHPGAYKFYMEVGVQIPEKLKP
mgnify:CR=1 FL=1